MGLKPGELPETWNTKYPDRIVQLHYNYFAAGSNIVNTNTFGAFITKFPLELERFIKAAIENANEARERALKEKPDGKYYIAFDIGSCGKLLKPMGDLDFEDCIKLFKKTFAAAFPLALEPASCGLAKINCVMIETMNDGYESKAAVLAAKETMEDLGIAPEDLPIIVSNVYDKECRTLSGSTPETMVAMLEGLGVSVVGVNCSLGPLEMKPTVERLCRAATVPVLVKPNAGLPKVVDGKTVFDVEAVDFVDAMKELAVFGPMIMGGCCGTTPEYIRLLSSSGLQMSSSGLQMSSSGLTGGSMDKDYRVKPDNDTTVKSNNDNKCIGCVSSNTKVVYFGGPNRPVLIGERINPTGKKKFKEALRAGDIPYIIHQGMEQEEAGAQVLDVNVGLPEIDEKK